MFFNNRESGYPSSFISLIIILLVFVLVGLGAINVYNILKQATDVQNFPYVLVQLAFYVLFFAGIFFVLFYFRTKYLKPLQQLIDSLNKVVEANFTRKLKLEKVASGNRIELLSDKVALLLDKVHYRTTQVMQQREEMEQALKNLGVLNEIGRHIIASRSVETIVKTSYEHIHELMDCTLFAIGIYNNETNQLDFWGKQTDETIVHIGHDDLQDAYRWSTHCFSGGHEIVRNEYDANSPYHFSKLLFNVPDESRPSFIYLPLMVRDKKLGIITVQSFKPNVYANYEVELLRGAANYISLAIENALAFQQIVVQNNEISQQREWLQKAHLHLEDEVKKRTYEILLQKEEIERQNKSLMMLSIVADQTHNAIMVMDGTGNILWLNKSFTRLYNYTYEEFIKARGKNIRQTSFNPEINETLDACINEKKTIVYEAPNVTLDGKTVWTQTSLSPVLGSDGEISYLVTIDTDITERKEYEMKIIKHTTDMTQSIQYARTIQEALLPAAFTLKCCFPDSFLMYRPKAIVSGDFYWTHEKDGLQMLAVADCTGHGVHGAFMSLLGISSLNDIVNRSETLNAAQILDRLRRRIKNALKQTDMKSTSKSGMDISLCLFDMVKNRINFAGAYQSLFIIRNGELLEFKGDRMPIGVHLLDDKPFTSLDIDIFEGDMIYLSTDGFKDQFNGENGRKFLSQQFKELLCQISNHHVNDQLITLEGVIDDWKGPDQEQTDDVTIMGLRIGKN